MDKDLTQIPKNNLWFLIWNFIKEKNKIIFSIILIILLVGLFYFGLTYTIKTLNNDIAKNILDYIRVVIWPFVVLTTVYLFKKELAKLIADIDFWEAYGIKFHRAKLQEKKDGKDLKQELKNFPDDEKNKLEKIIQEKEENLQTTTQTAEQLQKELISKNIELDFERIYNIIFASQINLLNKMVILGYLDIQSVAQHFVYMQRAYEPSFNGWNLSIYLQFLYEQELIKDINNGVAVSITDKGKAFLQYLFIMNYKKYGN